MEVSDGLCCVSDSGNTPSAACRSSSDRVIGWLEAILGSFRRISFLRRHQSVEVDILPIANSNDETAHLADLIEGVAGEFSTFEQLHGFSIDGVDLETSTLPDGWRGRLVKVQNANTAAPAGQPQFTGWCLDKEDLCVAKLCAFREKIATVAALRRLYSSRGRDSRRFLASRKSRPVCRPCCTWLESWIGVV